MKVPVERPHEAGTSKQTVPEAKNRPNPKSFSFHPTLDTVGLVPTKFQPICNRHFTLSIPGIDTFLVKKVDRPSYIRPKENWDARKTDAQLREVREERNAHKKLIVTLYDAICPSTRQQVQVVLDLYETFPMEVELNMLDPVGTVVGKQTYSDVVIERVDYDSLDYDAERSASEIKVTFGYKKEKLVF